MSAPVSPSVVGLMNSQRGLVTRPQALAAGMPAERIDRLVRTGSWIAVRRGVYAEREAWEDLSRWQDRQLVRDRAACLRMVRPHVLSHESAALALALPILRPSIPTTHVTRPGVHGSRTRFQVKHHLAPYRADQVVAAGDGTACLDLPRTAVDIAREHGLTAGVVALDSVRRRGVTLAAIEATTLPMWCWPESKVVREAIALSDPGSESVGETLARLLVTELGLGRPETQFGITDGRRTAWCDLRLGRHVFEFDGRQKYVGADHDGLATQDPGEVLWREKQRQDFISGFKLGVSRIVWSDFWGEARRRALHRLAREHADTVARFGEAIDDLAPYVLPFSYRRPA